MILCDHHIEKAIEDALLVVKPPPEPGQYDSSALNLRVGDDFRSWKPALKAKASGVPQRGGSRAFSEQETPLGSRKSRS